MGVLFDLYIFRSFFANHLKMLLKTCERLVRRIYFSFLAYQTKSNAIFLSYFRNFDYHFDSLNYVRAKFYILWLRT